MSAISGANTPKGSSSEHRDGWYYGDEDDGIILQPMSMKEFLKMEEAAQQQQLNAQDLKKEIGDIAARKSEVAGVMHSEVDLGDEKKTREEDSEDGEEIYQTTDVYEAELAGAMGQLEVGGGGKTAWDASNLPPPPPPPNAASPGVVPEVRGDTRDAALAQHRFPRFVEGKQYSYFNLKVVFDPKKTGFESSKTFRAPPGSLIAGRYEVDEVLGTAAFSTALQCVDLSLDDEEDEDAWVCLKVIKEGKDFFDQSLDEIKLLQYVPFDCLYLPLFAAFIPPDNLTSLSFPPPISLSPSGLI